MMRYWLTKALLLSVTATGATGQKEIGVSICACSASTYEFTFDFSLLCPPINITTNDAIAAASCLVSPFGKPEVTDLTPVAVQSIDILELGQDLRVLVQENIKGNFIDGDSFRYQSVTATPGAIVGVQDIPRAIQINIIGVNAEDEKVINVYVITFTNSCRTYPALIEGQSAGWTIFTTLDPPRHEFCPQVGVGKPTNKLTTSPVANPTVIPIEEPIASTSTAPSLVRGTPTMIPINAPDTRATALPTVAIVESIDPPNSPSQPPIEMSMPMGLTGMDSFLDMSEEFEAMKKTRKDGKKEKVPKLQRHEETKKWFLKKAKRIGVKKTKKVGEKETKKGKGKGKYAKRELRES